MHFQGGAHLGLCRVTSLVTHACPLGPSQFAAGSHAGVPPLSPQVRQLGSSLPYPFVEHCLKGLYLSYATACRATNRKTLQHVVLMSSCFVDMCAVDTQVRRDRGTHSLSARWT